MNGFGKKTDYLTGKNCNNIDRGSKSEKRRVQEIIEQVKDCASCERLEGELMSVSRQLESLDQYMGKYLRRRFARYGDKFVLVFRFKNFVIYSRQSEAGKKRFEVGCLIREPARNINGTEITAHERFFKDEDFGGAYGPFYCWTIDQAVHRLLQILSV